MIASLSREPRLYEGNGGASEIDRETERGRGGVWGGKGGVRGKRRARSLIRATAQPITLPYLHPVAPQLSRLSSLDTTRIYSSLPPFSPSLPLSHIGLVSTKCSAIFLPPSNPFLSSHPQHHSISFRGLCFRANFVPRAAPSISRGVASRVHGIRFEFH